MGILDDIKSNTIEELSMTELAEDYFGNVSEFEEAMKENTSIKEITFGGDFLVCLKPEDRAVAVSCLGRLPNLEKVTLKESRLSMGVCVTNLLKNSPKLIELRIYNCTLQGIQSDFDKFKDALCASTSMKTLYMEESFAPNEEIQLHGMLDGLKDLHISITA